MRDLQREDTPSILSLKELESLKHEENINVHLLPLATLLKRFRTDAEHGLTEERASRALDFYGANILKKTQQQNKCWFFTRNFFGGFSLLLWASAALCFVSYCLNEEHVVEAAGPANSKEHLYVGVVLIVVVIITGCFTYYQSKKSSEIMNTFLNMMPQNATVIRDGKKLVIPVEQLVVGDLVELVTGDLVPADLRLVHVSGLKVDNSCLTGESQPQKRDVEAKHESALEAENLAFSSTVVVEGSGRGIVFACGEHTQMGRIAELTSGLTSEETPLALEIKRFIKIITYFSMAIAVVFFGLALAIGYAPMEAALFLIAIMVANIPEGLLVTVTMCLTFSARQMARKNCLVKHLEAVEALGSTSVICSDKTGTLTQNKMTVSHVWVDFAEARVDPEAPARGLDVRAPLLFALCRVGMLCSNAEFRGDTAAEDPYKMKVPPPATPRHSTPVVGDASEAAILRFAEAVHGGVLDFRRQHRKVCEIPFSSATKFHASVHELPDSSGRNDKDAPAYLLVVKGAPEKASSRPLVVEVLELCSRILRGGGGGGVGVSAERISRETRRAVRGECNRLAEYGERVLGLCELELDARVYPRGFAFDAREVNFPLKRLVFVGLVALIDPPRPGVPNAVAMCRSAGIKVIMVTGDHPTTALTIARQVGIVSEGTATPEELARRLGVPVEQVDPEDAGAIVVHGSELMTMAPRELDEILLTYPDIVFARTTPTQKLNIVEACQRLGAIVAVTGDGVNDSPALKKANIGVAMGITGSDVARQAADLVLLDDNFATIVVGIEQGRIVFDNLKKSIAYTFTSNTPEMLPFVYTVLLRAPLPLGVMAILCINVGTDLWPAVSLAYEEPESDIMERKPRNPKRDKLVSWRLFSMCYIQIGMVQAAAGFYSYFFIMAANGWLPRDLPGTVERWQSADVDAMQDSYGQEWSFEARMNLEYTCHTAFFVAIMVTQIADVIICKTRRLSVFQKGMSNRVMNYAILFEVCFTLFFVYTPEVNAALNLRALGLWPWIPPFFFALYIFIYDEARKYWIRKQRVSFVTQETWY